MNEDAFREFGAQAANLVVDENSSDSFRTTLGMRAARKIKLKKTTLIPEVHARWANEWADNPHEFTAQFTALPGGPFNIIDRELPDASIVVGAGVTAFQKNLAFEASYDVDFGREDYINHILNLGVTIKY